MGKALIHATIAFLRDHMTASWGPFPGVGHAVPTSMHNGKSRTYHLRGETDVNNPCAYIICESATRTRHRDQIQPHSLRKRVGLLELRCDSRTSHLVHPRSTTVVHKPLVTLPMVLLRVVMQLVSGRQATRCRAPLMACRKRRPRAGLATCARPVKANLDCAPLLVNLV